MRKANIGKGALVACALAGALAGCAVPTGRETTGEYIDDAPFTTLVQASILDDWQLRPLRTAGVIAVR